MLMYNSNRCPQTRHIICQICVFTFWVIGDLCIGDLLTTIEDWFNEPECYSVSFCPTWLLHFLVHRLQRLLFLSPQSFSQIIAPKPNQVTNIQLCRAYNAKSSPQRKLKQVRISRPPYQIHREPLTCSISY